MAQKSHKHITKQGMVYNGQDKYIMREDQHATYIYISLNDYFSYICVCKRYVTYCL